jgi:putative ABC transport system permease protein
MTAPMLIRRSIVYYWRTHVAVAAGVAIAVAVLAGAFVVGDSVRASLRELMLQRLGNTAFVASSTNFFREQLATGAPLIALVGMAVHDESGRRASHVSVYGVDERFWRFHGRDTAAPHTRELLMSEGLARELRPKQGDSIQIRIGKPSAIPAETLHGRKDESVRTTRFTFKSVLPPAQMGDFALQPEPGPAYAVFVPLNRLQRDLEQQGKINVFLTSTSPTAHIRSHFELEDVGLKLRGNSIESSAMLLSDKLAETIGKVAPDSGPIFTYLANTIRSAQREIPYSLVTAIGGDEGIRLNEWAYRELRPKPNEPITFEYYVWDPSGHLLTKTATLPFTGVVPMSGPGGDRDLAPDYPGISDTNSLSDWDPPFPMDLKRIRKIDEDYWDKYRTAPKAFIALAEGQKLWGSRFGHLTSIRVNGDIRDRLKAAIDPLDAGFAVQDVRQQALAASRGSTDFGEYFAYFSFFLVISALLLAGLFFRFGIEQRSREIGLLRAIGLAPSLIRRLMFTEGLLVASIGALVGGLGALLYGSVVLARLAAWWQTDLRVHASLAPIAIGIAGGLIMAAAFLWLSLRKLEQLAPRELLTGTTIDPTRWSIRLAAVAAVLGIAALFTPPPAGFFAAAGLLLVAALLAMRHWLSRPRAQLHTVVQLGFRSAGYRPGRSVLCIALIAFATFTIVAVDAFRRRDATPNPNVPFVAESQLPIYEHPGAGITPLRVRTGDDASCLNLYQPQRPRIVAAPKSLGWTALEAEPIDGVIPALADANSLEYTLHAKVGDVRTFEDGLKVRFVGALRDSVFQSEIIVSEANFLRAFPREQGFRMFLIDAPADRIATLEDQFSDYGFDATSTRERLAAYHRVENMYLSTFQALGALGLLLGTAGLGAVLLRNLLERRRELALLQAVGYSPRDLSVIVLAENAFLLVSGLLIGTVCAAVAVAPEWFKRGGNIPLLTVAALPLAVLTVGVVVSWLALRAATRSPLVTALRSE